MPASDDSQRQRTVGRMGDALTWQANKTGIGVWEPLWLGDPTRQLYASLHRSAVPGARLGGAVRVPPLFHEQPRSRRLLTEMASGLGRDRPAVAALRFLRHRRLGAATATRPTSRSMCADLTLAAARAARQGGRGADRGARLAGGGVAGGALDRRGRRSPPWWSCGSRSSMAPSGWRSSSATMPPSAIRRAAIHGSGMPVRCPRMSGS